MLKSALRYIRQKPKAVRNQYALALASLFTGVVVIVWLASGASSLDKAGSLAPEGNTPFSNLIKQAKDQFASSREALMVDEKASSSLTTATSSGSGDMVLTAETLEGIGTSSWSTTISVQASTSDSANFGFQDNKATSSADTIKYIEVQIATTTSVN